MSATLDAYPRSQPTRDPDVRLWREAPRLWRVLVRIDGEWAPADGAYPRKIDALESVLPRDEIDAAARRWESRRHEARQAPDGATLRTLAGQLAAAIDARDVATVRRVSAELTDLLA
jgi:hypothetical protein